MRRTARKISELPPRNEIPGICKRTRKNLSWFISQHKNGADVHVGTQLTLSLLGFVVFPDSDPKLKEHLMSKSLDALRREGWPELTLLMDCPKEKKDATSSLCELVHHLRDAVSHHHIRYSSDSRDLEQIDITFEDYYPKKDTPYWRAEISAKGLLAFCYKFAELVDEYYG